MLNDTNVKIRPCLLVIDKEPLPPSSCDILPPSFYALNNNIPFIIPFPEPITKFSPFYPTMFNLKMLLTTLIVHNRDFPVVFVHCYEKNIIDKEKMEASLLPLIKFLRSFFLINSYPKDRYFQKIYLEIALAKEQENGNFLNIKKLPGSQYYFGTSEEELYSPVLQMYNILIINNIEIEGYPKDTRIYFDPEINLNPYNTAKNILLKELRGLFEQVYNATLKDGEIEDSSEEEKDLLFQAWVYKTFAGSDMIKKYEALLL